MPRSRSRLSTRLLELIPFDWIEADKIINELTPEVPPGQALRRYEKEYQDWRNKMEDPMLPPQKLEGDAAIRVGARSILNEKIVGLRREGYVKSEGKGKSRRLMQVQRLMFDGMYCCLHGGSCGGKVEPAAVEQPKEEIDWETPWTW